MNKDGTLSQESIKKNITKKTKIVSLVHVSNVLGTVNDVNSVCKIAHDNGSLFIVDAAQSVPHIKIDVKKIKSKRLKQNGFQRK